eukprot:12011745-Alexandrium_andersonii.AAC.1
MSASLVGSEMCIRDRTWISSHAPDMKNRKIEPSAPATRGRSQTKKKTVSYTHLTLPTICSV